MTARGKMDPAVGVQPSITGRLHLRLLLVAYDDQVSALVLRALRMAGLDVHPLRVDAPAMLHHDILTQAWDVVVCQYHMPGWSGIDAMCSIHVSRPELPVILVCGDIGADAAAQAMRMGASDCISQSQVNVRLAPSVQQVLSTVDGRPRNARSPTDLHMVADGAHEALAGFPIAIFVCNSEGHILRYNRAAAELWGRELDLGKDLWGGTRRMFSADGRELGVDESPIKVALRTGRPGEGIEVILERDDGSLRHVTQHPHPLRDDAGNVTGVVAMVIDLTERKYQERRLLNSDATSRSMFASNPAPCMMNIPGSVITSVNDRFVELSGFPRAELLGRTIDQIGILVDDADGHQVRMAIRQHGRVDGMEFNFRRKDGALRRAMVSSARIMISGAEQFLHSFFDLTVQHEALNQARLARQVLASISQGVLISDTNRLTLSVNQAFERMSGYTQAEMLGRSASVLHGQDTSAHTVAAMREALDSQQHFHGEVLNHRKDGAPFWNELSISPVPDELGRVTHFVGIQQDITLRKQQDAQRKLTEQIFAQSREGVVIADARRRIVMVNAAFTVITGYPESEVLGRTLGLLSSRKQPRAAYRAMWQQVDTHGVWQGEIWHRRRDGQEYLEWLTIKVLRDATGKVSHYTGTFIDITEQRAAQEKVEWLAHFDPLTGLPNRDLLADRCAHDIQVARRDVRPVAMMALDLDRFKQINDTLGFSIGRRVIQKFAVRLALAVRDQDTVARLQSDEFFLVLPGESPEGASTLAQRLLKILAEPFGVGDTEVTAGASIGIAMYPSDGTDFETLFKAAKVALHQSKLDGGQRHRFFSAELFEATSAKLALTSALRTAVEDNQLSLHYQPFVDMQTGRIGGMEALLRWRHPGLGAVSPATFIPMAEQSGQIVAIGAWVLRQACHDMKAWQSSGLIVPPMSVNLSPLQFRDPELVNMVGGALRDHDLPPSQICLELTEGAVMDDVAYSEQVMRDLKGLGVRLSLDDFGTGYSSLSYLNRFPFDKVKIDQSFVRDIRSGTQNAVIAKVIISMSHGLGLRVIAEGVETEAQCDFMRRNACDEIQGYFFSRPVPGDQMKELLRAGKCLPGHLLRAPVRRRTLLLVDDEPNVIAGLRRLLRQDGYHILCASNGAEALQLLGSQPVDIIVADQRMPDMTGVEFLRQAKLLYPQTIRMVLSGHSEFHAVADAINEGAVYRFLTKPWDDAELLSVIEQAFRHKELVDENERLNLSIRTVNRELVAGNRELKEVLDRNQLALKRGELYQNLLREALDQFQPPMLAIDDAGIVAFTNAGVGSLLGGAAPRPEQALAQVMPALDTLIRQQWEGQGFMTTEDERRIAVHWRHVGAAPDKRGVVLTLSQVSDDGVS